MATYESAISRILQVNFVQNSDEALQSSFYNKLLEFSPAGIKIKVGFGDPLLVSQGEEPDRIKVRLLKNFFTQTTDSGRRLQATEENEEEYYHIYVFDAPKQVTSKNELESLEEISDATE